MLNVTWRTNCKDGGDKIVFEGGFLGLDRETMLVNSVAENL